MFHKKIHQRIDRLDDRLDQAENKWRDKYYALQGDFERLLLALGLSRHEVHTVEFIRKGGPEKP
jgi:hypothetical protein